MVTPAGRTSAQVTGRTREPLAREVVRDILQVDGPLVAALAAVPRIADWALPLIVVLTRGETGSTITPRERQLLHLRSAGVNGPGPWLDYQGVRAGLVLGDGEVEAARTGDVEGRGLSIREELVLRWAASVTLNEAKREKATYAALCQQFTGSEVVELTGAVGMSCFLDRFLRTVVPREGAAGITLHTGGPAPLDSRQFQLWSEHCSRTLSHGEA